MIYAMAMSRKNRIPVNPSVQPDEGTDLYDVRRLANYLGVKSSTVRTLRKRNQIPKSISDDINGGAVWEAKDVKKFYAPPQKKVDNSCAVDGPSVVDLFAGCGGLSSGFRKAGFDVLAGFDNWDPAIVTYRHNLPEPAYKLDLSDVELTIQTIENLNLAFDGIIGGPPCQDFSSAGKRKEGARADLTEKYATIVSHFKPKFFVMENVARAKNAAAFRSAVSILSKAGYGITEHVLNAAYCNVPQTRKRLFTVGILNGNKNNEFESFLTEHLADKPMTMRDYFGDSLGTDYYYRHPRSYARRAVFSVDEPSPTIRGVNRPIPKGYPGHPGDAAPVSSARPLTTVERARVQTFEDFEFLGSKTNVEQLIGNAVPVNLAKYVGNAVKEYLKQF